MGHQETVMCKEDGGTHMKVKTQVKGGFLMGGGLGMGGMNPC